MKKKTVQNPVEILIVAKKGRDYEQGIIKDL